MTIIENTPERLIIEHVPWGFLAGVLAFMSVWVAGAVIFILSGQAGGAVIFIALGTFLPMTLVWAVVGRCQLILTRASGKIEIRRRSFQGYTCRPFPLANVKRVYIGMKGKHSANLFIEVTDTMDEGHHEFLEAVISLGKIQHAHDAIAAWRAE